MPGFVSANLERMKNALAAQKSAGQTKARGYGAVREAISGAGGRVLDVLGRKNLMRHELEKQTQAEKALSDLEGERAGYRSTLQQEGATQDLTHIERQAELDAEAEGKNIEYLKANGLWGAYLQGKRAGNPDADRVGNPGIDWLLMMWEDYRRNLGDELMVTTIDPVTQESIQTFQRDKVRWDDVRDYMVNAMSRDTEMQKEFLGRDGQYSEEVLITFIDSWIDTQKRGAAVAEGDRPPYGPHLAELGGEPLQGAELARYGVDDTMPASAEPFTFNRRESPEARAEAVTEVQRIAREIGGDLQRLLTDRGKKVVGEVLNSPSTVSRDVYTEALDRLKAIVKRLEEMSGRPEPEPGSSWEKIQAAQKNIGIAGE